MSLKFINNALALLISMTSSASHLWQEVDEGFKYLAFLFSLYAERTDSIFPAIFMPINIPVLATST